jgi:hypothetical protein
MIDSTKPKKAIKNKWGFYQYDPLPSEKELQEYYEKKYYQEKHGSYEILHSQEELTYLKLKASLIFQKPQSCVKLWQKNTS